MPKIVQYKLPPGGTVIDLADNQSTALEIEGVDSKDYLIVTTLNGSESLTLKGGGSAGVKVTENNQFRSTVADGWVFLSNDPTDTVPNICPSQRDLNTGIGHGAAGNTDSDQLSLIAGGVEGVRLTESGGSVTVDITGAISHTGGLNVNGDLSTQGAGTIESISTATVTGSGSSFTTVLEAGDAIKFTNDAGGTEIRTVKQINSNTELVLTETPGATGAGRGTKTYFHDPALLTIKTGDAVSKLSAKNSRIGINEADPDFALHVVGPGGGQDLSGIADATVTEGKFSAMFDNSTANGNDRNIVGINTNGNGGSLLSLYQNGAEKASFFSYDSGQTYLDAKAGELHLRTTANHKMDFSTNNTSRMVIDADGAVAVGSAATSNSSHEFEVNSGSNFLYFNITGSEHYVVGNRKVNFYGGGESVNSATFAKYGTQMLRFAMAESDGSRTSDTNVDQPAYLADSGATIICDLNFGCVGAFTLTADVTHVKFWNVPNLGTAQTITVKIKQHASSPKTISYSTVNIYSDGGSTTKNGSLLWSGGAGHVMSTGVDDIDIVQFTVIPTSDADRDVYGAVIGQNFS